MNRPGLRQRKKQATARRIADEALRLFIERGFDRVTVTEVAEAADVSVNTVYNYFPVKEDLVLPPAQASPDRLTDIVRTRPAGTSAAHAVLAHLRSEVRRRDRAVGLTEGFGRVLPMMLAAPTLAARLDRLAVEMVDSLAAQLVLETGDRGLLPRLVAGQIGWAHEQLFREIGRRTTAGQRPATIAAAALRLLDALPEVLGDRVLSYAVREERSVFRVTIRGKFEPLSAEQRAKLAEVSGIGYTEAGAFSHDEGATVFSFRCQVPAEPDDDEEIAELRAHDLLTAHDLPIREVLKVAVTDMRAIKIRRKRP